MATNQKVSQNILVQFKNPINIQDLRKALDSSALIRDLKQNRYSLTSEDPGVRERVFGWACQQNNPLLEMHTRQDSLEQEFYLISIKPNLC